MAGLTQTWICFFKDRFCLSRIAVVATKGKVHKRWANFGPTPYRPLIGISRKLLDHLTHSGPTLRIAGRGRRHVETVSIQSRAAGMGDTGAAAAALSPKQQQSQAISHGR